MVTYEASHFGTIVGLLVSMLLLTDTGRIATEQSLLFNLLINF